MEGCTVGREAGGAGEAATPPPRMRGSQEKWASVLHDNIATAQAAESIDLAAPKGSLKVLAGKSGVRWGTGSYGECCYRTAAGAKASKLCVGRALGHLASDKYIQSKGHQQSGGGPKPGSSCCTRRGEPPNSAENSARQRSAAVLKRAGLWLMPVAAGGGGRQGGWVGGMMTGR